MKYLSYLILLLALVSPALASSSGGHSHRTAHRHRPPITVKSDGEVKGHVK